MLWRTSGAPATARTDTRQASPSREFAHLQRLGVLDQLADVARERLLGADHAVDRKAFLAEQRAVVLEALERTRAMRVGMLNTWWATLQQTRLVSSMGGAGDQHVGVARAGLGQHVGLDAAAHHAAQLEALFEFAQARAHRCR